MQMYVLKMYISDNLCEIMLTCISGLPRNTTRISHNVASGVIHSHDKMLASTEISMTFNDFIEVR